MKIITLPILAAALLLAPFARAADLPDAKADVKVELQELIAKVKTQIQAGKRTEKDLTEELKQFDALLAKHKAEKTDDVAQVLVMKAALYLEVFNDTDKGLALIKDLKTGFPDTEVGKKSDEMIGAIQKREAARKLQAGLVTGAAFPDFSEKDLDGKSVAVGNFKGKVVLVDFWATWCGPCVGELPNVKKAYDKYHARGFEIIGISLDREAPKLTAFIKKENIPWQQFFDGEGKLAEKYGIESIPSTFLMDGEGKIIARDLRGEDLETALAKALK